MVFYFAKWPRKFEKLKIGGKSLVFIGKRLLAVLTLCLLVVVGFAGCTDPVSDTESGVNHGAGNEPVTYTIADTVGDWGFPAPYTHYPRGPGYIRMSFIFDTLIWKDQNGLTGLLADNWQYLPEENAYLFNLRQDVKWHDGKPFTAQDVLFTFHYVKEHPYGFSDTSMIKNAAAPDDYTVKVYLVEAYAPFLTNVAGTLPILPAHIYQDIDDPESTKEPEAAIGTGPYKLVDYNQEQGTYLYQANENYYLGRPRVDKIRLIKVSEQMTPAALLDGTVQAGAVPSEMMEKFKNQGYAALASGHDWAAKLMFNHHQEPFANQKFRQAIAYAIDRDKLVAISQRGHALAGSPGFLPPDHPWYSAKINQYAYQPEKSKELLAELGYQFKNGLLEKEGRPLTLELLIKTRFGRDAELIKQDLEQVGIKVVVRSLEDKTADAKINGWDFQLALSGHGGLGGDPEIFNKNVLGEGFNSARYYKNETLTALLREQAAIMDSVERARRVAEIQRIYAQELPALTLYYPDSYWVHNGELDLYYTPQGVASGIPIPLNKLSFIQ